MPAPVGANQQNVGVVPRHLADHFEHFDHGRAAAHDAVKLQVAQQLLLEAADSLPLVKRFGKLVQGFLEARAVDRFGDVVVGAALDGRDGVVQRVVTRHQEDVDARIALHRLLEELQAVHPRHLDVRHHHAHAALVDQFERVLRVACANGAEAEAPQRFLQHFHHAGLVVQNAYRHGFVGTAANEVACLGRCSQSVHDESLARPMPKSRLQISRICAIHLLGYPGWRRFL